MAGTYFGVCGQGLHRPGDQLAVRVALSPLVAIREALRHVPELDRVVAQVVVQVDQPGVDRPLRLQHLQAVEAVGCRRSGLLHRDDRASADIDDAVVERPAWSRSSSRPARPERTSGRRADRPERARTRSVRAALWRLPDQRVPVVRTRPIDAVVMARMALPAGGVVAEERRHAEREVAPGNRRRSRTLGTTCRNSRRVRRRRGQGRRSPAT